MGNGDEPVSARLVRLCQYQFQMNEGFRPVSIKYSENGEDVKPDQTTWIVIEVSISRSCVAPKWASAVFMSNTGRSLRGERSSSRIHGGTLGSSTIMIERHLAQV